MRVTPTGASEYHDGNEVGRYGLDLHSRDRVFVWYHDGLRSITEPAWAMDTDVAWKISVSVNTIVVADANNGAYTIDRDWFENRTVEIGGAEQHIARAFESGVTYLGDPNDHLQGHLWIESGNQVDENYHQEQGH